MDEPDALPGIYLPVSGSIQIPKPDSVEDSGLSLFTNSLDPGVGLIKFLTIKIHINGTSQNMIK
jgi:hypothetical protein